MSSKFGVIHLAKSMGIEVATCRGRLRAGKIKKNVDGQYGWDSKSAMEAVATKIKAAAPAKKSAKKPAVKAKSKPAKSNKKTTQADAGAVE
jgi:hypothetical protein